MEPKRDEVEEFYRVGWAKLLILNRQAHSVYPNKKMEPKSWLDHINMQYEAMYPHMHDSKNLHNLIIMLNEVLNIIRSP